MFDLVDHVRRHFSGMLVIGDLHADLVALRRADEYAKKFKLFLMSLGDIVDRGDKPYECVYFMSELMDLHGAGMTIGNHDDKFRRLALGNNVHLTADQVQTLKDVGEDRREEFLEMYASIQTREGLSAVYHTFDQIVLTHAASHDDMWNNRGKFGSEARARAMYGEVTGEREDDGMPIRYYNWINEIPAGKTVIVGHDRKPIYNVSLQEPLVMDGSMGGKVVFLDTGCGKEGFLSGAVVKAGTGSFEIDSFVSFKE